MFDLFEVFVKQLFQNPEHYYVLTGGNPKPQLAPIHSNTNAPVPSPSPIFTPQTILAQAPVSDRAIVARTTGRNRLKDYLPVLPNHLYAGKTRIKTVNSLPIYLIKKI